MAKRVYWWITDAGYAALNEARQRERFYQRLKLATEQLLGLHGKRT